MKYSDLNQENWNLIEKKITEELMNNNRFKSKSNYLSIIQI